MTSNKNRLRPNELENILCAVQVIEHSREPLSTLDTFTERRRQSPNAIDHIKLSICHVTTIGSIMTPC